MSANNQTYYALILPQLRAAYKTMSLYGCIFLLIPGLILNILMTTVFASRRRFWIQTTMGFYYTVASVASNLVIIIGLINYFPVALGQDLTLVSIGSCRTIWFFRVFLFLSSCYFHAQISIDRAISVLFPRRFTWLTKPANLSIVTISIYATFAIYACLQIARFFTFKTISVIDMNGNVTYKSLVASCILSDRLIIAYNLSYFVLRILDVCGKMICNCLIISKLRDVRKKVTIDSSESSTNSGMSRKEVAFAISLTSANFVQLVLVLPFLSTLIVQLTYAFDPYGSADFVLFANQLYAITNWGK